MLSFYTSGVPYFIGIPGFAIFALYSAKGHIKSTFSEYYSSCVLSLGCPDFEPLASNIDLPFIIITEGHIRKTWVECHVPRLPPLLRFDLLAELCSDLPSASIVAEADISKYTSSNQFSIVNAP